ncbi:MAG TPA: BTAD domain-containing putative transcriptional regulator [Gaiellaceae bacterium]|nr:BTAD domain-containing putative transcriptional regulator [Gaiellaceae bacterium]
MFRLLGPLEVRSSAGPVELRAAKPRALLTMLLLRANEVVDADALVDGLWGDRPPATARKLIQVYVSQLRRALGDGARLVTRPPGYAVEVEDDELDVARFEQLLAEGREALAHGRAARARRSLGEALRLWRGPALADFVYEDFARADVERLEELRLVALEERLEADLELGRYEEIVGELRALVERSPSRERLWRQLMLALYRSGRQSEALQCFAAARGALREQLGLDPGPQLRELQAAILRHDADLAGRPPAKEFRANLPAPLSPVVGRDREVGDLTALLRATEARLVTLVGAGGSGKTRLALEVAAAVASDYEAGAYLVELAAVRDSSLIAAAISAALGIVAEPGETQEESLRRFLRGADLLLVADNAEHLEGAGTFLVDLLRASPDLSVLVTSRAVLHVSGERVYPVAPLEPSAAVELFRARAEAAHFGFAVDEADEAILDDICERLDRLPLAIELAAPHVRVEPIGELRDRLVQRLPVLTAGPRDLPARQQTLRATLDWSHDLLSEDDQRSFRRLAAFIGGFELAAAEAVGATPLEPLVEQSLVRRSEHGRFLLLESVREYALERLSSSREEEELRRRHAEHYLGIVRSANLTMEAEGPMRHDLVLAEQANIRAALDWCRDAGEAELGLRLVTLLENYWVTDGSPAEGRRRIEELVAVGPYIPGALRALALRTRANCALLMGEYDEALAGYQASLDAYRQVGARHGVAITLQRIAVELARRGEVGEARRLATESLELNRELAFGKGEAVALAILANLDASEGNVDDALDLLERASVLSEKTGFAWWHARTLTNAAELLLREGRVEAAHARMLESLPLFEQMGDLPGIRVALAKLARLEAGRGNSRRAGLVWGASETIEAQDLRWEPAHPDDDSALAEAAGPEFEAGRSEGRRLELDVLLDQLLARP